MLRRAATLFAIALTSVAALTLWSPVAAIAVDHVVKSGGGGFSTVTPTRIVDTRSGLGGRRGALGPHLRSTFHVAGTGGVPTGAVAALLNVTVTSPTAAGFVAVSEPNAPVATSSVNFAAHATTSNRVLAPLDSSGLVDVSNSSSGKTQVVIDVEGYRAAGSLKDGLNAVRPTRIVDSRIGLGGSRSPLAPGVSRTIAVGGSANVPASARAAFINVTVVGAGASGYLEIKGAGAATANTTTHFVAGVTSAHQVAVPLSESGSISVVNRSARAAQLLVDVTGYVPVDASASALRLTSPTRIVDTRSSLGGREGGIRARQRAALSIPTDPVSISPSSAMLSVTVFGAASAGYASLSAGATTTLVSTVNFTRDGQWSAETVVLVAADRTIDVVNHSAGPIQAVVDVVGYTAATPDDAWTSAPGGAGSANVNIGTAAINAASAPQLQESWSQTANTPMVASDGRIFTTTDLGTTRSIEARDPVDGTIIWRTSVGGVAPSETAVVGSTVYLSASFDENDLAKVFAFDAATGALRWANSVATTNGLSAGTIEQMRVDGGRVYGRVSDGTVQAFDASSGARLWLVDPSRQAAYPQVGAITADAGRLYVNAGSFIDVWDGATAKRLWRYDATPGDFVPLVVADGHVLVAAPHVLKSFNAAGCGATVCVAEWSDTIRFGDQVVDSNDPNIAVGGVADGRAVVTVASDTEWMAVIDIATGKLSGGWPVIDASVTPQVPVVTGNLAWIQVQHTMTAYPVTCGDASCKPAATIPIPEDARDSVGHRIHAGAGALIYDGGPTAYVFRVP